MYTKAAVRATSATSLPMWGVEGSGMVPWPNMVADFRDSLLGTPRGCCLCQGDLLSHTSVAMAMLTEETEKVASKNLRLLISLVDAVHTPMPLCQGANLEQVIEVYCN
jgi:hypothetical protein